MAFSSGEVAVFDWVSLRRDLAYDKITVPIVQHSETHKLIGKWTVSESEEENLGKNSTQKSLSHKTGTIFCPSSPTGNDPHAKPSRSSSGAGRLFQRYDAMTFISYKTL